MNIEAKNLSKIYRHIRPCDHAFDIGRTDIDRQNILAHRRPPFIRFRNLAIQQNAHK